MFHVTLSAANWYILHKFPGDLEGSTPSLVVLIFSLSVYQESHLYYFPIEELFRL